MTFLDYFYSQDVYRELCEDSDAFPLTEAEVPYEDGSLPGDAWKDFEEADRKISTYIGNEDTPQGFEKQMLEIVQQVLGGACSVEEGLEQIQWTWEQCREGEGS